jgi:hypothetical protein
MKKTREVNAAAKGAARRARPSRARSEFELLSEDDLIVTFRLRPETVEWLRHWSSVRGRTLNGFAREVLDGIRLHGFVVPGQLDALEADRKALKDDVIDYMQRVFWRRAQRVEMEGPGFDKPRGPRRTQKKRKSRRST